MHDLAFVFHIHDMLLQWLCCRIKPTRHERTLSMCITRAGGSAGPSDCTAEALCSPASYCGPNICSPAACDRSPNICSPASPRGPKICTPACGRSANLCRPNTDRSPYISASSCHASASIRSTASCGPSSNICPTAGVHISGPSHGGAHSVAACQGSGAGAGGFNHTCARRWRLHNIRLWQRLLR
jgi:hypothetical protein